jgi:hypothetical protein
MLIVGATGSSENSTLEAGACDTRVSRVIVSDALARFHRRDRLENDVIDFSVRPDQADWWSLTGSTVRWHQPRSKTKIALPPTVIDIRSQLASHVMHVRMGRRRAWR